MLRATPRERYSLSEKPVNQILLEHKDFFDDLYDVEHVYVLGHSLGNVDIPYFKAVNLANDYPEKLHWYVSYYSDKEKIWIENTMWKRIISKGARLEMMTLESI